ncbi:4-(cytidine 5'-diphospho)-2-C-methyl-D-erythritol kinase [Stappia taiwanensis]|uniref:4-diphosphocytidyl-2-C-methyl-D-erythritol kinase n=1 Tax=Stappia taiwanensis TaxID=992267 RepID=A0A838XGL8_9HYPH|nr:4-(cytidine 5'-diphospho)-2-C-methyl-D-erythritol kinase [Stappia taiwanensis]MBA4610539.1 4-(cytidine 5'-diphospho)-2-C-methyl-D-erythritol kinase [Stappia taiwanensis]GGE84089.1 4-diphosphocytidyl-2-C-methyl-D-erythritol kinase [Stappia taiwanensis]
MAPSSAERRRLAPAKVNYALHVTGRRADGYHLIDSLVGFPAIGDTVTARPATEGLDLVVTGPFAETLAEAGNMAENLVLQAARALAHHAGIAPQGLHLTLEKSLPIAAGIGGGSSDATATLKLLRDLWAPALADAELARIGLALGADLPMCLNGRPARITGIGETVTTIPPLPDHTLLLVNPGTCVATPTIFKALTQRDNPPLPDLPRGGFDSLEEFVDWLGETRNDLEPPAIDTAPVIGEVLAALRQHQPIRLARMSGSGATCFAIVDNPVEAGEIATRLAAQHPTWWIRSAPATSSQGTADGT